MDPEELGFEQNSPHSRYVSCLMCGASGAGLVGGIELLDQIRSMRSWQKRHLQPHLFLCACGKAFPGLQALGTHVSANRRWRISGHGSMERVGWGAQIRN